MPERASASGMLGVTREARGSSFSFRMEMASSFMSLAPLVEIMTGSTTMFLAQNAVRDSAMVLIRAPDDTMPIFTASGGMSVKTASSWAVRKSGVTS